MHCANAHDLHVPTAPSGGTSQVVSRFSDAELESFLIDPREPASFAPCPFCGRDIVLGVRKETRNVCLAHAAYKDPTDATGLRYLSGCEPFTTMVARNPLDFLRACKSHGVRWERLVA